MIQTLSIHKLQAFCGTLAMCFPDADIAIAGGAVRDLLHDKPVKDIDCFIYLDAVKKQSRPLTELVTEYRSDEEIAAAWYDGCTSLADILHSEWEGDGADLDASNSKGYSYGAFSLVDFKQGLHMHPVQLVFINEHPLDNVKNHFDFGLSQCWVTQAGLGWTSAYWHDRENHRITYLRSKVEPNEQRRRSSRDRAERLKAKYPGWMFDRLWQLDWEVPKLEVMEVSINSDPNKPFGKPVDNGRAFIHVPRQAGKSVVMEELADLIRDRGPAFAENITKNNALLAQLKKKSVLYQGEPRTLAQLRADLAKTNVDGSARQVW